MMPVNLNGQLPPMTASQPKIVGNESFNAVFAISFATPHAEALVSAQSVQSAIAAATELTPIYEIGHQYKSTVALEKLPASSFPPAHPTGSNAPASDILPKESCTAPRPLSAASASPAAPMIAVGAKYSPVSSAEQQYASKPAQKDSATDSSAAPMAPGPVAATLAATPAQPATPAKQMDSVPAPFQSAKTTISATTEFPMANTSEPQSATAPEQEEQAVTVNGGAVLPTELPVATAVAASAAMQATAQPERRNPANPHEITNVSMKSGAVRTSDVKVSTTAEPRKEEPAQFPLDPATKANQTSLPTQRPLGDLPMLNVPVAASSAPQMSNQLDLARDLAWIGNLAQEIVSASDDCETLNFRLLPQSLGQLDVALFHSPEGLKVELAATTDRAAQIIAAEQPRLMEELRQSGVKMASTDLAASQNNGSQHRHPHARNGTPLAEGQLQPAQQRNRPDGRFA